MQDLVYGIHPITLLLTRKPQIIIELFLLKNKDNSQLIALAKKHGIKIQWMTAATLRKWVGEANHQGVVAKVAKIKFLHEDDLLQLTKRSNPLFLILDSITDPHNFGACLRSAALMGVTAVIIASKSTCGITATVRKTASGAAEFLPIVKVSNLARAVKLLKQQGIWLVSLAATGEHELPKLDLTAPTALIVGAEGAGVKELLIKQSDYVAKIPMSDPLLNSFNVSVACGICLYEVVRQRL